jgi:hypothetical protein
MREAHRGTVTRHRVRKPKQTISKFQTKHPRQKKADKPCKGGEDQTVHTEKKKK